MSACGVCGTGELPEVWFFARWCDPCLDEFLAGDEDPEAFVARKRAEAAA